MHALQQNRLLAIPPSAVLGSIAPHLDLATDAAWHGRVRIW